MTRRFLPFVLAIGLLASPAAEAANWQVDPARSTVKFSGMQDGQPFAASFKTFTADVSFDPADLAASKVTVTLPIAAIVAEAPMIQQEIAGADWFDARQFPAATFTATVFRKVDDSHFEAEGTLTIRDHSRPLTLPFTFAEAAGRATVTAAVSLKRNDYGIGQGRWATDPSVAQDVKVEIALEATRQP